MVVSLSETKYTKHVNNCYFAQDKWFPVKYYETYAFHYFFISLYAIWICWISTWTYCFVSSAVFVLHITLSVYIYIQYVLQL